MKNQVIDFNGILEVIKEIIAYAQEMKVEMEDPVFGEKRKFQISDMSISCIFNERIYNSFYNGLIETKDSYSISSSMLISIWIKNGKKICRQVYTDVNIPLQPKNLKIHLRSVIYNDIFNAMDNFFVAKIDNNKYSVLPEFSGEHYIGKTSPIRNVSQKSLEMISQEGQSIYRLARAMKSQQDCIVMKKTNLVADSSGTSVIEANTYYSMSTTLQYLSSRQTSLTPSNVKLYKSERAMVKDFGAFSEEFRQAIDNIHDYTNIPSGVYPILMDPAAVHTLIHEALGAHMFSASYIANERSMVFKDKIGVNLADYSEQFEAFRDMSIYCRPNDKRFVASYLFDNEGTKSKDVCLLKKGVVMNFLTCRNSSHRLGLEPGGHALAQSFNGITPDGENIPIIPEPRISNLVIQSHNKYPLEEMRKDILELCRAGNFPFYLEVSSKNGQVDVESGNFMLFLDNIKVCFLDGTKKNVLGGTLAGDLFSFVSTICGISNTYGEDIGMCGASSGFVPTHGKTPYMYFFGINFVPTKEPEKVKNYDLARDKENL